MNSSYRSPDDSERWVSVLARRHLPALDGMRAVAVFLVILGHLELPFVAADLGVTAFFVLSGFLITLLLLREREATGDVSLRKFYARRALRILPAYLAYLAFTFSLDSVLGDMRWKSVVLPALTYTVNYYNALNGHPTSSVSHTWSLAVEEQFYLFWPLAFILLAPRGNKALARFLIGAISVVIAIRCALYFGVGVGKAYVYNAFETRFDNLAVGCLLAMVGSTRAVARTAVAISDRGWYPIITLLALFVARFKLGESFRYGPGLTLEALLIAVLLVQLLLLANRPAWRMLEVGVVTYLGRLSYSLYLYHGWGSSLGRKLVTEQGLLQIGAQIVGCIVLAMGSYHIIETPFLRFKDRFSSSRRVHADAATPDAELIRQTAK